MKTINVVAAVIIRPSTPSTGSGTPDFTPGTPCVFATQRGYGDWKGWWEFPGGKIEDGESPEAALAREIKEELTTEIKVGNYIQTIEYDYPKFHLSMRCYACEIICGKLELLEHENAVWLTKETLRSVKWLPADQLILDKVEELL